MWDAPPEVPPGCILDPPWIKRALSRGPQLTTEGFNTMAKTFTPRDSYSEITNAVIAALEAGTAPWRKPWTEGKGGIGPRTPHNAVTGLRYRGINTLLLGMSPVAFVSGDPRWCTYKQAEAKGWHVRKGEKGTMAVFFKRIEVRDVLNPDGDSKFIPMLKTFTVFNGSAD